MKRLGLSLCFALLVSHLHAQETTKAFPFGALWRSGLTTSVASPDNQVQSNQDYLSLGYGLYAVLPVITVDSTKREGGFLRFDLGFDNKKGRFVDSNNSVSMVSTYYYDLNILGHVAANIGDRARGYAGLGLTFGYVVKKEIEQVQSVTLFEGGSKLVFGTNFELGFILGNSSYLGIRTLISSTSDLKYSGTSLVLGISPQPPKKKRMS